jgi:hypothetical protein
MSVTSVSAANGQLSDGLSPGQFYFWERLPSTYLGMPTERLFKCGRIVAKMILAITLTTVTFTTALGEDTDVKQCVGPLSLRLAGAALNAPRVANSDGTLYGLQRWRPSTDQTYLGVAFPGFLSCAYTVSAIFGAACHPIGALASVGQVDAALSGWQKNHEPKRSTTRRRHILEAEESENCRCFLSQYSLACRHFCRWRPDG